MDDKIDDKFKLEKSKKFLLIEDDDDHAMIIKRIMKKENPENILDRVSDGVEALRYLHREGPYEGMALPDVVLLDLNLPKKSGHEVLSEIKEDPLLRLIPIVVLTTSDAEIDKMKAYEHYANSYLVKPLDQDSFRKLIQEFNQYWSVWNRPTPPVSDLDRKNKD